MKSKASIASHPLHPILVSFPIAFFAGTLLFDALVFFIGDAALADTARYLNIVGIVSALVAALPGFIDYLATIPPKSSAKKRGLKHGVLNVGVVLLFIVILWLRAQNTNALSLLLLDVAGVVGLVVSGWMGGTLVHRNQIGVDIRYAGAGKWKEVHLRSEGGFVNAASAGELQLNQMKLLHVEGRRIVLGRSEQGYAAFDDHCTHRGGSLAGGAMICGTVQCPWHGSQFDVHTGACKAGPAKEAIRSYAVEERNGRVYVKL